MRLFAQFLLLLITAVASAQLPTPPADSTLAGITARGRMLQQYDIAAWHGGDAIAALQPKPGEISASVARRNPDGSWQVTQGRLNATKDSFYVTYQAVQTNADSGYTAIRFSTPAATAGVIREIALASETARQHFGKVDRPYNTYVIPAPVGGFWVYILPAQTDSRTFPLGGDVRYRIVDGTTIADSVRFHRSILERATGPMSDGNRRVASIHTSFDSLPSETDVFVVLRQSPHLPELVATKNFTYEIGLSGSITWVRAGQTAGPIASSPAMVSRAGHIPVWPVKVDTLGSAPRTMSPGYTEWRDTTTGWRMTFDRIIPIQGADSGSYNPSWRALLLPDGKILVTRPFPAAAVQMYDLDGRFVREIGRAGNGPDDFTSTPTLALKGDTLVALDGVQARVHLFTLDGRPIRSFPIGVRGSPLPIGIDPRGFIRVQQRFGFGPGDTLSRLQWIYYTTNGVAVDTLRRPPLPAARSWQVLDGARAMSFQIPFSPSTTDVFLPDGSLMYGSGSRFEFFVTRNGRDTTRIFGRSDVQPVPLSVGLADSTMDNLTRSQPLLRTVASRSDFPANFPLWNSATVDDKGYIWVSYGLSGRGHWDVCIFSPDGRYLGPAPLWWERLDQMSFGADRMAYISFDRDRRAVIRVYKVERRGP